MGQDRQEEYLNTGDVFDSGGIEAVELSGIYFNTQTTKPHPEKRSGTGSALLINANTTGEIGA
jgi:hypothetical protein